MAGVGLASFTTLRRFVALGSGLTWPPERGLLAGWAGLGRAWLGMVALLGLGAGGLQMLGPRTGPPPPASERPVSQHVARVDAGPTVKGAPAAPHSPKS